VSIELSNGVEEGRDEVAAFGPFRLLPTARRLERDGKPVELGGRALDVLAELVRHAGRVVSKADLMSTIWADTTVVEGVLRTHVYNLRKALGDGVAGARYVTSVAGRGYCFVAPVIRSAAEVATPASRDTRNLAHGLPPRLARMAGRDDAVRGLAAELAEHRFVTVLGPAGIGKTTVAVAVGHALLDDFGGAVRFIELGALTDPALVVATVASTLGVPMHEDHEIEHLQAFLQDKRVLLVLDNCEHVVEAAASLAEYLFLRAPRVHLLTTGREALRVEGEHPHRLGPLETPMDVVGMNAETVQTFPAVQVFLERAAAGGWSGELRDEDVPIVAETCRRLDGVALAIELAASFVGQCGIQGMTAVLDDRLGLLWQQGRRTAPPRQQTLHALIAWSYDRLRERERAVLRRLSVFVGTFSFDAAKAVVLEEADSNESLLELINELVAKSLVSASVEDNAIVYRLLETTRVYALERLGESGELDGTSLRHALLFVERLERVVDLGNARAALKWSFSSPAGYAVGVRLAAAATKMLLELGLVSECQRWCRQALDVIGTDSGTLMELGLQEAFGISSMFSTGNGDDARRALTRGIELARALGGGDHEVRLLGHLNSFLIRRGEFEEALEVAERSLVPARVAEIAGQVRVEWMLAFSHHLSGNQAVAEERCRSALGLDPASGELAPVVSRRSQGFFSRPHLGTLARTLWLRGHADRGLVAARRVFEGVAALKHSFEKSSALILCEGVFVWCGEWGDAARLLDMLSELVERYSLGSQRGGVMALRGELLVKTGRPEEGCALLRTAASMQKAERNVAFASVYAGALAEGLAATGSLAEALGIVEGAIVEAERRGGTFDLPELLRIKGVLLASRSQADDRAVREVLSAAIALARRQGALAWELRATTALVRERLRRGRPAEVLSDLSAVYARFTEGADTPDLRAARSLLEGASIKAAALPASRRQTS
jgi:predicted ATPase/DNA-binding winged helix-turn-helix (wHTH) protein